MKNKFGKLYLSVKNYITTHKKLSVVIALILIISGIFSYRAMASGSSSPKYVLAQVTNGTFVDTITGTGQISAADQVDVKPQGSSQSAETITEVDVKQGDTVKKGQLIAVVDNKSAKIQLEQAQNSLLSAEASYNKLINGSTQTQLLSYQTAVTDAEQNLANKIASSYASIDNVIRTSIDPLYQNPTSPSPVFAPSTFDSSSGVTTNFTITDANLGVQLSQERKDINDLMTQWKNAIDAYQGGDLTTLTQISDNSASQLRTFIDDVATAINSLQAPGTKFQDIVDSDKSTVGSARSSISSALNDIVSSEQSLTSAENTLLQQKAPARPEDIQSSKASLDNARTSLQSAQDNYDQSFLRAPFDGVIAKVGVSPGDQANTSTLVATIITKEQLATITLNEVDAAKVKLGDPATLTLDAIPDLTISGSVAQIDTIGTVTQGVVNYSAQIAFNTTDDRVKPGMSVSVSIITDTENNVLLVPNAAIKSDARGSYVQELPATALPTSSATASSTRNFRNGNSFATTTRANLGSTTRTFYGGINTFAANRTMTVSTTATPINVPITVGASNDTYTIVTSGLNPGDRVITQTVNSSTVSTATRTTGGLFGGGAARGGAGAFGGARTNVRIGG